MTSTVRRYHCYRGSRCTSSLPEGFGNWTVRHPWARLLTGPKSWPTSNYKSCNGWSYEIVVRPGDVVDQILEEEADWRPDLMVPSDPRAYGLSGRAERQYDGARPARCALPHSRHSSPTLSLRILIGNLADFLEPGRRFAVARRPIIASWRQRAAGAHLWRIGYTTAFELT